VVENSQGLFAACCGSSRGGGWGSCIGGGSDRHPAEDKDLTPRAGTPRPCLDQVIWKCLSMPPPRAGTCHRCTSQGI